MNIKKITEKLDLLCDNNLDYTDEELSDRLNDIYNMIPTDILLNYYKSNKMIKDRVKKYCKENNLNISYYKGVLPYRSYNIPVNDISEKDARKQIKELMNDYKEELNWDETTGEVDLSGSTYLSIKKDYWFPIKDNKNEKI